MNLIQALLKATPQRHMDIVTDQKSDEPYPVFFPPPLGHANQFFFFSFPTAIIEALLAAIPIP